MKEINAAFNSRDMDRIMACFAEDATFLMARGPEADGRRVRGKEARAVSVWMVSGTGADEERL
jgi:ketosteroid isomerase-like protein